MPRKGKHVSDRRWIDEQGDEWASKFEHDVYQGLRSSGYRVRRCDESDTVAYYSSVTSGRCVECGGTDVVQARTYTADLFVVKPPKQHNGPGGYLVECKGYFPRDRRALFCAIAKECKRLGTGLRIIFESNRKLKGTQQTPVSYIHRYAKNVVPGVWDKKTEEVTWFER